MTDGGASPEFAEFYRREFGRVVASVRGQFAADAEDAAQDAFIVAARRWDEVAELDVPVAWVRRVALRMAGRRAARERQRRSVEGAPGIAESPPDPDLDLVAAMSGLRDRHAAAVRLHHLEGRPVAEVANRLGCSVNATKVLLLRTRALLAERLTGLTGVWVSEQSWSPDAIAGHLRRIGAGQHVGPILDRDLGGRGGRWELTLVDGRYKLHRSDGKRLDHGVSRVSTGQLEFRPTLNSGRAAYRPVVDGDRLHLRLVETTIPDTLGVPDSIWISLYLESGAFRRSGPFRQAM